MALTGSVNWQYQRDEASSSRGTSSALAGVQDDIAIVAPTPSGDDVAHSIKKAMVRDVTPIGTVCSWPEHDAAMAAAWAASGVTNVNDRIAIVY